MISKLGRLALAVAGLSASLCGVTGCQTQIAGMTLPSGYYLDHRPQYFPVEPSFPLPKELATMQAQSMAAAEANTATTGRLPAPVVGAR